VVVLNRADTLADGVAVRQPDPEAFEIIRRGVSRIVTVTDEEIGSAIRAYWTDTHNLVEGAGAAPLAVAASDGLVLESPDQVALGTTLKAGLHAQGTGAVQAMSIRLSWNALVVQPVGQESEAKNIASNVDDGIEKNYKAVLISKGLDKQHIKYDAKNGVLTLKGNVKTPTQRKEAELLAQSVPNVQQVLNELDVKR